MPSRVPAWPCMLIRLHCFPARLYGCFWICMFLVLRVSDLFVLLFGYPASGPPLCCVVVLIRSPSPCLFFLMRCFPSRSPPRRGGNPHLVPLEGVLEALSVVLVLVLVLLASPAGSYKLGFGSDFSLYLLVFVLQMPFLIGLQSIIVFAK